MAESEVPKSGEWRRNEIFCINATGKKYRLNTGIEIPVDRAFSQSPGCPVGVPMGNLEAIHKILKSNFCVLSATYPL